MAPPQRGLDSWVGYLSCTGGAINPEKSYCYLVDYLWTGTRWRYRNAQEMSGEVNAPNPEGEIKPLQRLEPSQAAKQLGIFTAPDGNSTDQFNYLMGKAETFADKMKSQNILSKNDAWINLTHTITKTMEYPMGSTTLVEKQWDKIATTIKQAALPKAGIVRTFPHAVLYGPSKFQGLDWMNLWHDQELTHLYNMVDAVNGKTKGLRYQATTEQLRLETGYPGRFTEVPFEILGDLTTDTWIKTLWSYCHQHSISIKDSFGTFDLLREHDVFLMPLFVSKFGDDPTTLRILHLTFNTVINITPSQAGFNYK